MDAMVVLFGDQLTAENECSRRPKAPKCAIKEKKRKRRKEGNCKEGKWVKWAMVE